MTLLRPGALRAWMPRLVLGGLALALATPSAAIDLADRPLFSTVSVPGNLALTLSVEYPTANTAAYFSTTPYATSTTFQGYFDSEKCYRYLYNSTTPTASYFTPYAAAAAHACSSSSAVPLWSGNYLNWAAMQSLDIFRWVLTGGNRSVDTGASTILQKTYHSGQGGASDFPNKSLTSTYLAGATPFNWTTGMTSRVWGAGIALWISGTNALTAASASVAGAAVDYTTQNSYTTGAAAADSTAIYTLYMNVKVCDGSVSLESNCTQYGSSYKPEGLIQQYSSQLRYAAFGYLNDSNPMRDAGVLRARMKYVGPTQPVPGAAPVANSAAEWDSSTGIMTPNPDSADAAATTSDSASAGYGVTISQSGVMNYLNKFGYSALSYKTYDPVSELYYAPIRYFKNQGNVPAYSSLAGAGSTSGMAQWLDGFPVIQSWSDPIVYSCQKNFVLGIGDVNTWRDADLPGTTLYSSAQEPTEPTQVSSDGTVNVTTATNMVSQLEGLSALGSTYVNSGRADTYYMAGLAYDSHTKDIRPDLDGTQTINTYWLDVQEYQTYVANNQFYLATKYGGFTVPSGFQPYAGGNGPSTLSLSSWHTNGDTNGSGSSAQPRPDNYFSASNAGAMKSGLQAAFAKIASEAAAANSTAFSAPSPNVATTGSVSYSAGYDPQTWTGQVIASSVSYDGNGVPTLTELWDARALLSASSVTSSTRKIVTCCTTSTTAPGLPFTSTAFTNSALIGRTNYGSFASVPGVSASSQSTANYIAYLRGDTSQELANGGAYRTRAYRLGDIVNSKPVAVSGPQFPYYDTYNPGYAQFKLNYASRKTVVYAGANDGMLHAFDGSSSGATAGGELFAYVPSFVYGTSSTAASTGLATLGDPTFTHHAFVDATPTYADVDFSRTAGATGAASDWRSLIVGGLGKGGTGYFALDVTDPGSWSSEANVASKVLWEFTDANMGYSYGEPLVVKTAKYGWVVVVSSGYNNGNGVGYFYFIHPRTGALLEAVATPAGSANSPINLGPVSSYVANYADETADALYAGDLQGNLWRVDVTGTTGTYPAPTLIARLTDPSGNGQPVTTRPLIEVDASTNKRYVLVGTGRLLADSDISSSQVQSFYSIADGTAAGGAFYQASSLPAGASFPVTRSQLNANTNLLSGIGSAPTSAMGWYFDMPVTSNIAQRVNVDPTANSGVVAWVANLPNGSACEPGGVGTLYATTYATGKTQLVDSSGNLLASSSPSAGVLTDVSILRVGGTLRLYTGASTGDVVKAPANLATSSGIKQLNWRGVPLVN